MNELNTENREVKVEVYIPLTKGQITVVDWEDFDKDLRHYSWYAQKDKKKDSFAAVRTEYCPEKHIPGQQGDGKNTILMHRQIAAKMGFRNVDHKNMNRLDNRRHNLRPCSQSQNLANANKRQHNTSGFKGVNWNTTSKAWSARIGVENKRIFLGYFNTAEEAAKAYDDAAKQYFGEFSRLNKPKLPSNLSVRTPHHNTTGFPGVSRVPGTKKFRARVTVGGNRIDLGCFDTAEEAYQARNTAAQNTKSAGS